MRNHKPIPMNIPRRNSIRTSLLGCSLISTAIAMACFALVPAGQPISHSHAQLSSFSGYKPSDPLGVGTECAGAPGVILVPPFNVDYSCANLGSVPGAETNYGGLTLKYDDPNTLLIGGQFNSPGHIYQIAVVRDADMHITGFSGEATLYPSEGSTLGEDVDGGVVFGPGNVLFITKYPDNQLEQDKPGSIAPDKVIDLDPLGIVHSVGAISFVPEGFPGAGSMKIVSFDGGGWYHCEYSPDGNGTYNIDSATIRSQIDGGPEGIAFVRRGSPDFPANSVLIAEYSSATVVTAPLDSNGDPIVANLQSFMEGFNGAEGACIDPLTGDLLLSSFDLNQVIRVSGFAQPRATPTPRPRPTPHPRP